jgi:hypothetical protein
MLHPAAKVLPKMSWWVPSLKPVMKLGLMKKAHGSRSQFT